jgi:hypothetical protein
MNMLRNKKVLVALAVIAVLALAASFVAQRGPGTEENNEPALSEADKKFYTEKDKEKAESLANVLNSIAYVYNAKNLEFPSADEAGWSEVVNTVPITEAFFDPYVEGRIYQFAKGENPEYGEIQYGPGMACDDKAEDKTLKNGYGRKSLALRAKFSDGYRCVNNFQGK